MKIYTYRKCDSCRKAIKWLDAKGIIYEEIPIREQPPSKAELKRMYEAAGDSLKPLFNTAGGDYRQMGMKDKLPGMSLSEAFELLSTHGNLVKRPFVISKDIAITGFKPDQWVEVFS